MQCYLMDLLRYSFISTASIGVYPYTYTRITGTVDFYPIKMYYLRAVNLTGAIILSHQGAQLPWRYQYDEPYFAKPTSETVVSEGM